jgi:hypothetical protein
LGWDLRLDFAGVERDLEVAFGMGSGWNSFRSLYFDLLFPPLWPTAAFEGGGWFQAIPQRCESVLFSRDGTAAPFSQGAGAYSFTVAAQGLENYAAVVGRYVIGATGCC